MPGVVECIMYVVSHLILTSTFWSTYQQMKKNMLKEDKPLAQGYTAAKKYNQELRFGLSE